MVVTEEGLAATGDAPCARQAPDRLERPDADSLQRRLDGLRQSERTSRALARAHLRSTSRLLCTTAGSLPDHVPVPAPADDAGENRRRARKCLCFAAICRRRAARLTDSIDGLFE